MLGPSCVVVLLILYLLDLCHHVDLLSLYISQQLVSFGIYIVTVSQLTKGIVKCGPDANIIILLLGLVSGICVCKSVRRVRCGVCTCSRVRESGSILLHLIKFIISLTTLVILHMCVIRGRMTEFRSSQIIKPIVPVMHICACGAG